MEEIPCVVSPLKLIRLSGNIKSGCAVVDISFPTASGVKVSEVRFKNNYTATLSIKGKLPGSDGKFTTLVEHHQLMQSPHYANDSQNSCTIKFAELAVPDEPLVALRFILRQPSSIWQVFSIEEIKLFKTVHKYEAVVMEEEERSVHQYDRSLGDIVNRLGELINHMERVQNQHLDFEPAPFDIDGCYDINLLSYT